MTVTSQGRPGEDGKLVAITVKAVALITIYAVYGVLQERIMKGHYENPFSTNPESFDGCFSSAPFLVLCNRLVSLITGLLLVQLQPPTLDSLLPSPADSLMAANLPPWLSRLKPASPLVYYARVAFLNNAATLSQYTSLAYLSFTTLTLGKSAKMAPILILGSVGYGKRYKQREWIGVTVIIFGIWAYLVLLPEVPMSEAENKKAAATNLMGLACLLAYLFFDGLTSTTQERLFKKDNISKPLLLGLSGAVMDQMIWVNWFSLLIALVTLFLSLSSSTASSIKLTMVSPVLQFHIMMLSLTATCGLLLLFHVIAVHGALVAGLIMTLRQFVSVLCNAVWFGSHRNTSPLGWAAIGLVAAGVWIKMDRRYDNLWITGVSPSRYSDRTSRKSPFWIRQYLIPLLVCPLAFIFLTLAMTFTALGHPSTEVILSGGSIAIEIPSTEAIMSSESIATEKTQTEVMGGVSLTIQTLSNNPPLPIEGKKLSLSHVTETQTTSAPKANTHLSEAKHIWDDMLVKAVNSECPRGPLDSVKNNNTIRTALATYPRSGSSYTRTLLERATGYQTSSIYCDPSLLGFFHGECDYYNHPWLVKTHFPCELIHGNDTDIHWRNFDRYLEIVRNPVDVIWSVLNLMTTKSHTGKLSVKYDSKSHSVIRPYLQDWNEFLRYWDEAPIRGLVIRYEDLRHSTALHLAQIIEYILPEEDLPSPAKIACALKLDPEKEPYASPKSSPFENWEKHFTKETFDWIIEQVADNWCKFGYDRLLLETRGTLGPVSCPARKNNTRVPIYFVVK